MSSAKRLLIVTGSREDFGIWTPVLQEISRRPSELQGRLLVTGMHLDDRFGATIADVERAAVPIAAQVACTPAGDTATEMASSIGAAIVGIAPAVEKEAPDLLLLLGDRGEQLAAAIVALHLGVAVAHLHGGEQTFGAVDDTVRDLITRIAHVHFVATSFAAERLKGMGEAEWRIRVVGAPGLDLLPTESGDITEVRRRLGLTHSAYALVIYHPETVGESDGVHDIDEILSAIRSVGLDIIAIAPNADAGGRAILRRLETSRDTRLIRSLPRSDYVTLLANAAVLIGNSSSGIIEAPLLGVPAVNVGGRQEGRTRGDNVIDVAADSSKIQEAVSVALSGAFRSSLTGLSPYGDGQAARRIVDAIADLRINPALLRKSVG